jgi:hypothetical protein
MTTVSAHRTPSRDSEQWIKQLRPGHARRDHTVATLRDLLLRVAFHELSRRRGQLRSITGPEFDDLAHQAATTYGTGNRPVVRSSRSSNYPTRSHLSPTSGSSSRSS